jgi:uncharacterized protein (TIGR02246 family)
LLEIARSLGAGWAEARTSPAMARRSQISGRLLAVLDPARRRHGVGRPALIAAVLLCLGAVLPTAALNFRQAPSPLAGAEPAVRPVPEAAKAAIVALETAWREALKRGDIETMARLYTRDAVVVASTGQTFHGHPGVMEALRLFVAEDVRDVTLEPLEIYPLDGMICEVGRATMWRASGGAAGIRFMSLWKQENGVWRIHRDYATQ